MDICSENYDSASYRVQPSIPPLQKKKKKKENKVEKGVSETVEND